MAKMPKEPVGPIYKRIVSPDGRIVIDIRMAEDPRDPRQECVWWRPRVHDATTGRTVLDLWAFECDAVPIWPPNGGVILRPWVNVELTIAADVQSWSLDGGSWRPIPELQREAISIARAQVPYDERPRPQPPQPAPPRKAHWLFDVLGFLFFAAMIFWLAWDVWHGNPLPRIRG